MKAELFSSGHCPAIGGSKTFRSSGGYEYLHSCGKSPDCFYNPQNGSRFDHDKDSPYDTHPLPDGNPDGVFLPDRNAPSQNNETGPNSLVLGFEWYLRGFVFSLSSLLFDLLRYFDKLLYCDHSLCPDPSLFNLDSEKKARGIDTRDLNAAILNHSSGLPRTILLHLSGRRFNRSYALEPAGGDSSNPESPLKQATQSADKQRTSLTVGKGVLKCYFIFCPEFWPG